MKVKITRYEQRKNQSGWQKKPDDKKGKPNDNGVLSNPPPILGNISIKNASDLRRLLVNIINQLRRQPFDVQSARAQIYAAHELREVFVHIDLEDRIKKLEEVAQYGGQQ